MSDLLTADRLATKDEVRAKRGELKSLAEAQGFSDVAMTDEGTLVVHDTEPSYRRIAKLAGQASRLVGAYVQVIADDVPAASVPSHRL